jgi:hypothetical protein
MHVWNNLIDLDSFIVHLPILREHLLEKIAIYLSRCGLQSNAELMEKGYPDLV